MDFSSCTCADIFCSSTWSSVLTVSSFLTYSPSMLSLGKQQICYRMQLICKKTRLFVTLLKRKGSPGISLTDYVTSQIYNYTVYLCSWIWGMPPCVLLTWLTSVSSVDRSQLRLQLVSCVSSFLAFILFLPPSPRSTSPRFNFIFSRARQILWLTL